MLAKQMDMDRFHCNTANDIMCQCSDFFSVCRCLLRLSFTAVSYLIKWHFSMFERLHMEWGNLVEFHFIARQLLNVLSQLSRKKAVNAFIPLSFDNKPFRSADSKLALHKASPFNAMPPRVILIDSIGRHFTFLRQMWFPNFYVVLFRC